MCLAEPIWDIVVYKLVAYKKKECIRVCPYIGILGTAILNEKSFFSICLNFQIYGHALIFEKSGARLSDKKIGALIKSL